MACYKIPGTRDFELTRIEPRKADITGTWLPDEQTIRDMREAGGYTPASTKIILRDDGSAEMVNMPDWLINIGGHSQKGFFSESGAWTLSREGAFWRVEFISTRKRYMTLDISYQKPPHKLSMVLGDPDSAQFMTFIMESR